MNSFLSQDVGANSILQDIARARENIQKSLAGVSFSATVASCSTISIHSIPTKATNGKEVFFLFMW